MIIMIFVTCRITECPGILRCCYKTVPIQNARIVLLLVFFVVVVVVCFVLFNFFCFVLFFFFFFFVFCFVFLFFCCSSKNRQRQLVAFRLVLN